MGRIAPGALATGGTLMIFEDYAQLPKIPLEGSCSGVYFLYQSDELVYIGQGWNCLLRVAEHTRKDSDKIFTHWSFVPVTDVSQRKQLERDLRAKHNPKYNRV
jgi:predicted GIY-YIG superfamily endonuclease